MFYESISKLTCFPRSESRSFQDMGAAERFLNIMEGGRRGARQDNDQHGVEASRYFNGSSFRQDGSITRYDDLQNTSGGIHHWATEDEPPLDDFGECVAWTFIQILIV